MNIFEAAVYLNTSADQVKSKLEEIAQEWLALGIETPVIDNDAIDPDAYRELQEQL
ncbi:hypothetical protein [Psychromicrobium lacuslunae]|uniref:hypothetical protein n=1 Tax=Psychromicrobium lacuslunae TaxID=1618207 RepID=UPI000B18A1E1|nr:hypothetical protein [Psychromicrobium lacuslunae]